METSKIGKYRFLAEPFHCDFDNRLFMGHLGNHLLNAADFHSTDRGFGMNYLMPRHKTWVLSRLVIEMCEMPAAYDQFDVETWVESAMRYFTARNFAITSPDGRVFGKMGHTERIGKELYRNVPGQYEMELFTSAVRYFK